MKKLLLTALLLHFSLTWIIAQDEITVEPGKKCPMIGMSASGNPPDAAHQTQNQLKNRYNFPQASDFDATITLSKVLQPGDDHNRFSSAKAAQISGYVMDVRNGGKEGCNCNTSNSQYYDTHIALSADPNDLNDDHWMVVEVTPRIRDYMHENLGIEWTTASLQSLKGQFVKFQGWMMFDNDHVGQARNTNPNGGSNWRATCWELHPVTAIEPPEGMAAGPSPGSEGSTSNPVVVVNPSPESTTEASIVPIPLDAKDFLAYILLAALLGLAGQVIRFVAGVRKAQTEATIAGGTADLNSLLITKQAIMGLLIAVIVGSVAGVLAAVNAIGSPLDSKMIFLFIASGYAGTDLIEGFIIRK